MICLQMGDCWNLWRKITQNGVEAETQHRDALNLAGSSRSVWIETAVPQHQPEGIAAPRYRKVCLRLKAWASRHHDKHRMGNLRFSFPFWVGSSCSFKRVSFVHLESSNFQRENWENNL